MAQGSGGKRKRGQGSYSQDHYGEDGRPSPHRPDDLRLAQHGYTRGSPIRGGRRASRGGRPLNSPNGHNQHQRPSSSASNSMPSQATTQTAQPMESLTKRTSPVTSILTQTPVEADMVPYYIYQDFTDDAVSDWNQSRKRSIIRTARMAKESRELLTLQRVYQETLRSGLDNRIPVLEAAEIIRQIVNDSSEGSAESVLDRTSAEDFLDIVAICHQYEAHHPNLQTILLNCGIPLGLIRTNLDDTLLEDLRLVRRLFSKAAIRHGTNVLYRMKIHNLLREETEGYSKLVTELFTTSTNEPPSPDTIAALSTRVNALIGTFNLDVGRVFDITLDVFASVLIQHSRFFIKYLRSSFWWPTRPLSEVQDGQSIGLSSLPKWALPDVQGLRTLTEDERVKLTNAKQERDVRFWGRVKEIGFKAYFELGGRRAPTGASEAVEIMDQEKLAAYKTWIEETGTLPPLGNETAAQLLGFKLRFYGSEYRDRDDEVPKNLIFLTALLIKIGFVSLFDLYAHLWPSDEAMDSVRVEKEQQKKKRDDARRAGKSENALTRAGALPDDTMPSQSRRIADTSTAAPATALATKEGNATSQTEGSLENTEELPQPLDQKIDLLKSFLCIGALPESLFMLGRFPWLLEHVPDMPEYIHRILHYSLSNVYEPLRPLKDLDAIREPTQVVDPDPPNTQKGELQLVNQAPKKVLRWPFPEKTDVVGGIEYRFYWEDWVDNIPLCNSIDDVFLLCDTFLNLSGLKIGQDPILLVKLARIGMHSLDVDTSDDNTKRWFDLCKRLLVPALSFSGCNSGIVTEVWALLKRFPTSKRYNIYGEWYQGQTSRRPEIIAAFEVTEAKSKDVLKRISKTNTKTMARALAKVAVSSPGKVFEVALKQIESFDNLIEVVVESSRYFTDLAYDILTWSLVNALGRSRSRVQDDGMLTSKWLNALGSFGGSVFKRYGVMNPTPLLQYVANQLQNKKSTDLVVLENLVNSMAGILPDATLNDSQVVAMTGGPHLRYLILHGLHDRRHDPSFKASARRLMRALINPRLAGVLLVSIAQRRQSCVFDYDDADAPLKLLGNLFDEIHRVLTQYLDLLHTHTSQKDFRAIIPSIAELVRDFGIEPSAAFWFWRPILAAEIAQHDKNSGSEKVAGDGKEAADARGGPPKALGNEEQPNLQDGGPSKAEGVSGNYPISVEDENIAEVETVNGTSQASLQPLEPSVPGHVPGHVWHPVMQEIVDSVRPVLPAATFELLSESFYFTFWRLSSYDLHIPDAYQDECRKAMSRIEQLKNDRSDMSNAAVRSREQEKRRKVELHTNLSSEHKEHLAAHLKTRASLLKEKDVWFEKCGGRIKELSLALLEYCFVPRILLSSVDAFYVFKMFKFLHAQGAKNFKILGVIDALLDSRRLTPLFFMCTAKEAEHLGRFLNDILKDLAKWHASSEVFEKEAHGPRKDLLGCFVNGELLDYERFRSLLYKWHGHLSEALKACFQGGEYMHIRNGIIILKAVVLHFPVVDFMGDHLVKCITYLSESDPRSDLKLAALSLLGNIKRRSKSWIVRQEFSLNKPWLNGATTPKADATKAKTPQPETRSTGKSLNAKAPEFFPGSASLQASKKSPGSKVNGDEDGEIKDAASTKLPAASLPSAKDAAKTTEAKAIETRVEAKPTTATTKTDPKEPLPPSEPSPVPRPPVPAAKPEQKPASLPPVPPKPRLEAIRNQSDNANSGRPPHGLPERPELPSHATRTSQRPNERFNDRPRDLGDARDSSYRRTERPLDAARDQAPDRHGTQRAHDRPEKPYHSDREKQDVNWGGDAPPPVRLHDERQGQHLRDARPPLREERSDRNLRDRAYADLRDHRGERDLRSPRSGDDSMGPPRSVVVPHPDRAAAMQASQGPDREQPPLHLDRRLEAARHDGHGHPSSQRGSRASSPGRYDDRASRSDHHTHRDERSAQDNRRQAEGGALPRHFDPRFSNGARPERPSDIGHSAHGERLRDGLRSSSHTIPSESSTGRLSHDFKGPRQQESQYGRLNQDPPAGPRMPNGTHGPLQRNIRNVSAPQPFAEARPPPQLPTTPTSASGASERQTPTGPALGRGPGRNQGTFNRPPPITTSIPPASVSESPDTAGVHPDRLKAIQSTGMENSTFARSPPTPVEAPAGPRATAPLQPQDQHPPTRPSGPAANPSERGRGDKRFAGLNTVLSQASTPTGQDRMSQLASIRGRHSRANIASSPSTSGPLRRDFSAPTDPGPPPRQDLFANRPPSNSSGPPRDEEGAYGGGGMRSSDRKAPPRQRDARSASPRREAAPPPSRIREEMRQLPRADEARDHRIRGGPPLPVPPVPERDRRGGPRDNVGPPGPKDRREHDRKDEWNGDRMGGDRRDPRPEKRVSGTEDGGSGRKRLRGPEEAWEQGRPMGHEYPKRMRRGG